MNLNPLNDEERKAFYHRYCKNDLFRQWSPILAQMEREYGGMDAATLWYHAEQMLNILRETKDYRDALIPELYNNMLKASNELTAVSIITLAYTRIMNAVEAGHETETFPNRPMCMAIVNLLRDNKVFLAMTDAFFKHEKGNDGCKVVIVPSDPMMATLTIDDLDQEAQQEVEKMKKIVLDKTKGLRQHFDNHWEQWQKLWDRILLDTQLFNLLCKDEPRVNDWKINKKMVCNVVGMFNEQMDIKESISKLSSTISTTNVRSYISNPRDAGTDSAFNKEQYEQIRNMIMSL
ncbi:MAG: hypothetical protein IJK45_10915 [Bacteroidaceae bacterium]|nr:hypothetical protein [Bacteroidaceae bacterium]